MGGVEGFWAQGPRVIDMGARTWYCRREAAELRRRVLVTAPSDGRLQQVAVGGGRWWQ